MNLGICGICGRMGIETLKVLMEKGHSFKAAFDSSSSENFGKDAGSLIYLDELDVRINDINRDDIRGTEGVIDFSLPSATMDLVEIAVEMGKPLVIGTTGFSEDERGRIEKASKVIPILFSPNMSLGVNLLFKLIEIASGALNPGYDVEIFEAHHRFKKDAPSGTAKRLVEIIKENMQGLKEADEKTGRQGNIGERSSNEIGIMAMRGGDIVGEHTVYFNGVGERIELTHRASSRKTFAQGAVLGMEFLAGKKAGLYSMYDVLGL